MAYAHFPINCIPDDDAKGLRIANFLGEKHTREVKMLEGVTVSLSSVKDELVLDGIDIQNVSQSGTCNRHFFQTLFAHGHPSGVYPHFVPCQEQGYSKVLGRHLCFGEDEHRNGVLSRWMGCLASLMIFLLFSHYYTFLHLHAEMSSMLFIL